MVTKSANPKSSGNSTNNGLTVWAPTIPIIDWDELHKTISIPGILQQAASLQQGESCDFAFNTNTSPYSGSQSLIFVVKYAKSNIKYGFRIPYHSRRFDILNLRLNSEWSNWKAFTDANIALVPRIVSSDISSANAIGFPFVAYEWIEGSSLVWKDDFPPEIEKRDSVIKTLARFTIESASKLSKKGSFAATANNVNILTQTGNTTARVYVTQAIDRKIARVVHGQLRTAKLVDCLRQRSLVNKYVIPELEEAPWIMVHDDLSQHNIIVDNEGAVSG